MTAAVRYGVITAVPGPQEFGNLALGEVYLDPQAQGRAITDPAQPLASALGDPMIGLYLRVPVFRVGELLVIDSDDRDQLGRKPSKWMVTCEYFDDIAAAVRRVHEATA